MTIKAKSEEEARKKALDLIGDLEGSMQLTNGGVEDITLKE